MNFKLFKNYLNLQALTLFLGLLAISGAVIYYFYSLNYLGLTAASILALGAFFWLNKYNYKPEEPQEKAISLTPEEKNKPKKNKLYLALILAYLLLYIRAIFVLFNSQSDRALISPWEVVPSYFWLIFFALSIILIIILALKIKSSRGQIALLSIHYFLSFSVALIVYKINYGFDPFIHQATLELIAKTGSVSPKPFYYLGEYSLIIFFNKFFGLSIYWLNRLIVPLLAALLIPSILTSWLKRQNLAQPGRNLAILSLLILPFSIFIMNTPQNLSYLFLILTIFSIGAKEKLVIPCVLAVATFCIHPLTGLAALGLLFFLFLKRHPKYFNYSYLKILKVVAFILLALSWPLAFFYASAGALNLNGLKLSLARINLPLSFFPNQEGLFLNFSYLLNFNYLFLLAFLILAALFLAKKRGLTAFPRALILTAGATFIAWLLSSLLSFTTLINYEQNNYPARLLIILVILFLPLILPLFLELAQRILKSKKLNQFIWLFVFAALLSAALYGSYPRRDNYFNAHGYSVSRSDLEAVRLIASKSQEPYVVLANQQTSAAALKEEGFDHYFARPAGPIYFYPIPTGGELYQLYLDMVYQKPRRATMLKAMDLAGVNEAYFVISKYWTDSKKIIENAKLEADNFQVINQGEIYIFSYLR